MGNVEPLDGLIAVDDFLVAVAPAKTQQVVEQRLGQDAEFVAVGVDAQRAVALGHLRTVRAVDQRNVCIFWDIPAHALEDHELAESVVQVVIAADHVGDAHVVVIDHDREHVGRRAVAAQDDEIVDFLVPHGDRTLDEVLNGSFALARRLDAYHVRLACGPGRGIGIAPFALDAERAAFLLRLLTAGSEFLGREVAAVGVPLVE